MIFCRFRNPAFLPFSESQLSFWGVNIFRAATRPSQHAGAGARAVARARALDCDRFPRPLECECMGTPIFYAYVTGRTLADTISNVGLVKDAAITIHANVSRCITEPWLTVCEVRPLIGPA